MISRLREVGDDSIPVVSYLHMFRIKTDLKLSLKVRTMKSMKNGTRMQKVRFDNVDGLFAGR